MSSLKINLHELVNEAFQGFAESGIKAMKAGGSESLRQEALKEAARKFGKQMAKTHTGTFIGAKYNLSKNQRAILLNDQELPAEFEDHTGLVDLDRAVQVSSFVSELEGWSLRDKAHLLSNIFIHPQLIFNPDNEPQRYYNMFFKIPGDELFSHMDKVTKQGRDIKIQEVELLTEEYGIEPFFLMNQQDEVMDNYYDDKYSSFKDVFRLMLKDYRNKSKSEKKHFAQMVRNMQAMATNYSVEAAEHFKQETKSYQEFF